MRNELQKIIEDITSGSLKILLNLVKYSKSNYANIGELKSICEVAKKKLSHFAAIKNFITQFQKKVSSSNSNEILLFLKDYESKLQNVSYNIYEKNKDILSGLNSITTLSFSKTLLEIIKIISEYNRKLKVFVLESRPILEGRKFISELNKLDIDSTLIVDSLMCYALKKSEAVIIGADQILKNGNVVNKIGSYPLALCAKEFNKPFYVIADKSKFVFKLKYKTINNNDSEVWKTRKRIKIINHYFEEVPSKLITKILTD